MEQEQIKAVEELEFKPIPQCETIGEMIVTLNHLVKELSEIPGVKASMEVDNPPGTGGKG